MKSNAAIRLMTGTLIAIILAIPTGCSPSKKPVQSGNAMDGSMSEDHEHDEDHHDHFPPHWPKSIFRASERLEELITVADKKSDAPTKANAVGSEQELADLLKWLPELCADSDLSEKVFNEVDQWSNEYASAIEEGIRKGKSLSDLLSTEGLQKQIRSLSQICSAEQSRLKAMEE